MPINKTSISSIFVCYEKFITFAAPFANTVRWCNGSTADFGSACLGSSPGRTTKRKTHYRAVR